MTESILDQFPRLSASTSTSTVELIYDRDSSWVLTTCIYTIRTKSRISTLGRQTTANGTVPRDFWMLISQGPCSWTQLRHSPNKTTKAPYGLCGDGDDDIVVVGGGGGIVAVDDWLVERDAGGGQDHAATALGAQTAAR